MSVEARDDGGMTLGDVSAMLCRRARPVLCCVAAFLIVATVYCLAATRRYRATSVLQVQKESSGSFGLDAGVMGEAADVASDSMDYNITLQTEAQILESDMLAIKVITGLGLESTRDYFPQPARPRRSLLPVWLRRNALEPLSVPLDRAPNRRYAALKIFAGHLKVEPVTATRLIRVSYANPDPVLAARVVNALVAALTEYSFQARFAATAEASSWLAGQLSDLKKQTEALQARAVTLQRDTGLYGPDGSHNVVVARLDTLNTALSEAESLRIVKEATWHAAESGDPELIAGLNSGVGPGGMTAASVSLLQTLRAQESALAAEIAEAQVRYGPHYPGLEELRGKLSGVRSSIEQEVTRTARRAHTEYLVAATAEKKARTALEEQKQLANALNDKAIAYGLARQEADGSRDLYEGMLSKLKQAGVLEGLRSTNITVVSPAEVPAPNHPASPNVPLYYAAALLAGLMCGVSYAVMLEMMDQNIRSVDDAEQLLGAPLLAVLPQANFGKPVRLTASGPTVGLRLVAALEGKVALDGRSAFAEARSPFVESLRSLRTGLLLSRSSAPPRVLLLTSSIQGEGKSTVSLNLAMVMARQGARVLLVEADLRCPVLHRLWPHHPGAGLSTALSCEDTSPEPLTLDAVPGLSVLLSGPVPPFPAELLGSERMRSLVARWRTEYDFILLDSPPVLPVTDGVLLAQMADAVVLIARHEYTARKVLLRTVQALKRDLPEPVVIGTVLNAVPHQGEYYSYYGLERTQGTWANA